MVNVELGVNTVGVRPNVKLNENAQLMQKFKGQKSLNKNSALAMYTWNGDLDLDGRVAGDDYKYLDEGLQHHKSGWWNGDLNYDGSVTRADQAIMDAAFWGPKKNASVPPSSQAGPKASVFSAKPVKAATRKKARR
jgi:hypothetical protein